MTTNYAFRKVTEFIPPADEGDTLTNFLQSTLINLSDNVFAAIPQKKPSLEQLEKVKIISHRGTRDDIDVFENTFKAFDTLIGLPIWGIEFDVRWTKDLWPVIFHDPDFERLYDDKRQIADLTLDQVNAYFPEVPTLKAMAARYHEHFHLTIELKRDTWIEPAKQQQRLLEALEPLKPVRDYHLMSFDLPLLTQLKQIPSEAILAIMNTNTQQTQAAARRNNWAGVGGHYLILNKQIIENTHNHNQIIATGFPNSKNSLYREINRGADWIFVDDANMAVTLLDALKNEAGVYCEA